MLVVGTATEVGKTWVSCALARALRGQGVFVSARKPVQSLDPDDGQRPDADLLAEATGEHPDEVCGPGFTYELPMAPPMAAEALGLEAPSIAEIVALMNWPTGTSVGIVETAGGVCSPLASDGDAIDLAVALDPDLVLLVADPGLGTLNSVRSVARALSAWPLTVLFNRYQPDDRLHELNRVWLRDREGLSVHVDVGEIAEVLIAGRW